MAPPVDTVLYQSAWLARWEGDRLPSSSSDWQAALRAFPSLSGSAKDSPAWALVNCLYDDPEDKPGIVASGELRRLDTDRAVSGVVYWIFWEIIGVCANESLGRAECRLDGLRKLVKRTGGMLSAELTQLIRLGLAELDREIRRRR